MTEETKKETSNDYITFKRFSWIIGILAIIFSTVCGVLYNDIGELQGELTAYKSDMFIGMSAVKDEISAVKQDTATTQKDVEWIKKLFESKIVEF